jgi:hypothetical protein
MTNTIESFKIANGWLMDPLLLLDSYLIPPNGMRQNAPNCALTVSQWELGRRIIYVYLIFEGRIILLGQISNWKRPADRDGEITIHGTQNSEDGLNATTDEWRYLFAGEEFCLSVQNCREDNFSGIIIYYFEFEVTQKSPKSSSDW